MDRIFRKQKRHLILQQSIIAFIFLYLIASIVWWYIELCQANDILLQETSKSYTSDGPMKKHLAIEKHRRNEIKYLSEGLTVVVFILGGWFLLSFLSYKQLNFSYAQSEFLSLLAHEIKTPITIGKLSLQKGLTYHTQDIKALKETIQEGIDELNRLNKVSSKLLLLLRLEGRPSKQQTMSLVHISDVLLHVTQKLHKLYGSLLQKKYTFSATPVIKGDEELLDTLFSNLIENACKHSKANSPIQIHVTTKKNMVKVSIRDTGVGIDPIKAKNLFKKSSYRTQSEGLGLGLYLAHIITQQHKAILKHTTAHPGSLFTVEFPIV